MIPIRRHPEGAVLPVRVQPGASSDRVVGEHGGRLRIRTSAPPEKGRANEAVLEILARRLGRRARDLEILAGLTSRDKDVLVRGATVEEVQGSITNDGTNDGEKR